MSFIEHTLVKLLKKQSLTFEEAFGSMEEIMTGQVSPVRLSAWLTALKMKGETPEEISGCASSMNRHCIKISCTDVNAVDTCGTGGDGAGTFNISTAAAFIAAGAGVTVAKHGNRAASSMSGSADILSELGVNLNLPTGGVEQCLNLNGIAFLFAPVFHPAMKYAMPVRKELGTRTVFNIIGPLCNPADVKRAVIGVYDKNLCPTMAKAAKALGKKHVMVVHGHDGLDEITTTTKTFICELKNGDIKEYDFDPHVFDIPKVSPDSLLGRDPSHNAKIFRGILTGDEKGPLRDIVVLNTAAAIIVSGKADSWEDGLSLAEKSIDNGAAHSKLKKLAEFSMKQK